MRRFRIPLGQVGGIRIAVHPSWFVILVLVAYAVYTDFATEETQLGQAALIGFGLLTSVLFFSCLIAHELAHALLARRLGIPVRGITLFLLGGVAEIGREVRIAQDEFAIALAGPMASVALGAAFAVVALVTGETPLSRAAGTLAVANGAVAAFNLVPGLPLDGGRLLRAAIWAATDNYRRATRIGVAAGRLVALGLLVAGGAFLLTGSVLGLWYFLLAWFLDEAARGASRASRAASMEESPTLSARG